MLQTGCNGTYLLVVFLLAVVPIFILLQYALTLHEIYYVPRRLLSVGTTQCPYSSPQEQQCTIGNDTSGALCIQHSYLLEQLGRPEPCQHSFLILECPDPCKSYLEDENVYRTCGINTSDVAFNFNFTGSETRKEFDDEAQDMESVRYVYNTHPELCTNNEILVSDQTEERPSDKSKRVPNIVHYVSVGCKRVFNFVNYLSVLSVERFIRPEKIYFHGDCLPRGKWWTQTLSKVPNIYYRHRERPKLIQGRKPMWVQHETDVIRLEVLQAEGGIYLDADVLVLKPVEDLRNFPITMGHEYIEMDIYLGSSFILTEPNSKFMCVWLRSFREYNPRDVRDWAKYAVIAPGKVYRKIPDLIHVEERSFHRPNWAELQLLYDDFYDWSNNYIIHLWSRNARGRAPQSPGELPNRDNVNCTVQEVMRYIYFGDKHIKASLDER